MPEIENGVYNLNKRLKQIDTMFDESNRPLAVTRCGFLSRHDENHYVFSQDGKTNMFFLVSNELVEERGYTGDETPCVLVEYTSGDKRKLEIIPILDQSE